MEQIKTLVNKIKEADSVVIGAGSGMSNAAGMDFWYQNSPVIMNNSVLKHLYEKYHFQGLFNGFYTQFRTEGEHWAFLTELAHLVYTVPPQKPTYDYLKRLVKDKPVHIITSNQDELFLRFFPEEQVSRIQGSWSFLQSSNPEVDKKLYDARKIFNQLLPKINNYEIAEEDIPVSDLDGSPLIPWVRGPEFLEDKQYFAEHEKFNRFIGQYKDKKVLFIELGVGRMTPMFIQEPFWEMTQYLPDAFYVNINPKDALTNPVIKNKSLLIEDDINEVLKQAVQEMEEV